jgi:hypothetical protein
MTPIHLLKQAAILLSDTPKLEGLTDISLSTPDPMQQLIGSIHIAVKVKLLAF